MVKRFKQILIVLMTAFLVMAFISAPSFAKMVLFRGDHVGKGSLDLEHNLTVKKNVTVDGNLTVSGTTTVPTGSGSFEIPLPAFHINGTGPMGADGSTAPGIATTDNIPKIVYASSAETASIGYSFGLPSDYSSGLAFRMLLSSSAATPASMSIDWQLFVNRSGVAFDAVPYSQTAISPTLNLTATNENITFSADATALAGISAGDIITLWFWNADSRAEGTTEIGNVQGRYTKTR